MDRVSNEFPALPERRNSTGTGGSEGHAAHAIFSRGPFHGQSFLTVLPGIVA